DRATDAVVQRPARHSATTAGHFHCDRKRSAKARFVRDLVLFARQLACTFSWSPGAETHSCRGSFLHRPQSRALSVASAVFQPPVITGVGSPAQEIVLS